MNSHYDPAVTPLAVSQQTSASSARDMALRKGCPPVVSPLRYTTFQDSDEKRRPKKHILKKQPEVAQRKVTHVDLTAFFPQFKPSERPVDSHLKIETATSVMVVESENNLSRPPGLRSWTGRRFIQITNPPEPTAKGQKRDARVFKDERSGALPLSSQLLQPAKDVENWLDDAEVEDKFDTMGEKSTLQMFISGDQKSLRSSHDSSDESSSSIRTMTSQVNPTKVQSQSNPFDEATPLAGKANTATIPSHQTQQSNVVHVSKIKHSDLQLESVLALSSSEDDSETEARPTTGFRRRSRQNRSTKVTNPPTRPADPNPSQTQQHPLESILKQRIATPPPRNAPTISPEQSPTLPKKYEHLTNQHSTPAYWPPDMIREPHHLHPSSQPSPLRKKTANAATTTTTTTTTTTHTGPPPNPPSTPPSPSNESPRFRSRMMAVSPEEEKLLSLMRHKRASMRKDPLPPTTTLPRPKTADTDRPPSSFFEPDMTLFPKPPSRPHPLRRLSSEDLRLGYRSDSSAPSPALSAEEAPLTPASAGEGEEGLLGPFGDGDGDGEDEERYDEFGSEGQIRPGVGVGRGHARKRTMSTLGSVLCLDGMEERARLREEEEDLAMWGAGRCI
ncbi:hypothetical protein MMC32_002898 [Xylographa parallela]|nr:hypothetical protein [Xylographa parallela]